MGEPQLKGQSEKYTFADYITWPDEERWELIEGKAWDMSPAPNREHQRLSMYLSVEIYSFLKDKPCEVYAAPFDVRLPDSDQSSEEDILSVVQPDLAVICDKKKLDKRGCVGAPDLIVEILSPSTSYKDETHKLKLYEKHGVREYWVINHDAEIIMVHHHNGEKFDKTDYLRGDDILMSSVLPELELPLKSIFTRE